MREEIRAWMQNEVAISTKVSLDDAYRLLINGNPTQINGKNMGYCVEGDSIHYKVTVWINNPSQKVTVDRSSKPTDPNGFAYFPALYQGIVRLF